jgi:hypothetical protein
MDTNRLVVGSQSEVPVASRSAAAGMTWLGCAYLGGRFPKDSHSRDALVASQKSLTINSSLFSFRFYDGEVLRVEEIESGSEAGKGIVIHPRQAGGPPRVGFLLRDASVEEVLGHLKGFGYCVR